MADIENKYVFKRVCYRPCDISTISTESELDEEAQ